VAENDLRGRATEDGKRPPRYMYISMLSSSDMEPYLQRGGERRASARQH
jgi:hypothetical protein